MKAIIMAGGEGSRLRPLTCGRPKPMVPVLNRPVMHHIVNLLKKHGWEDIGVTLQYMPDAIRDYFGKGFEYNVNLKYFIEDTPLGTAGSVKNAEAFLDETFIVISGDALTDLDLTRALQFHKEKGAMATLVLTRVDNPLEYGVVITDDSGHVRRFLEKPGWGEVFSDTVNTGIYILEPEVLRLFQAGRKFDFSKDLFPLLLEKGMPLYGIALPGYWCDIGNLEQYLQAHYDIFNGRVEVEPIGREVSPGVRVEEGAEIPPSVQLEGPSFIGRGVKLAPGVSVDSFSVIGDYCRLGVNSSVKRSILWNNVFTGPTVSLRGAVIAGRSKINSNASVYEGAVIGSDCHIGERSLIKPNIKIWPKKSVDAGSIVQSNIIWGNGQPKKLFGLEGISGSINTDLTPESVTKLAAAYASTLGTGARVAVSSDSYTASKLFEKAAFCGLQSAGAKVFHLETSITPIHRFAVRKLKLAGGIHVKMSPRQPGYVNIILTNEKGSNLPRNQERKVENVLAREDFLRVENEGLFSGRITSGITGDYLNFILDKMDKNLIIDSRFKIVASYDETCLHPLIDKISRSLGLDLISLGMPTQSRMPLGWAEHRELLPRLAEAVVHEEASLGVMLEHNADRIILIDDRGEIIQEDMLTALTALLALKSQGGPVIVPVTAPRAIESLAQKYAGKVIRTKTALQDFLDILIQEEERTGGESFSQFLMNFDGLFAFCTLLQYLSAEKISLSQLREEIPSFFMDKKDVSVPWAAKGRVIRRLISEGQQEELELLDGVKVYHPEGWALVLPDPEEPVCRVFSEGISMEVAESLSDFYIDKINNIMGEEKNAG